MNKNGFTLVELLSVIIILAIILVIAIPKLTSSLSESKENLYNSTIKEIERTASQYVSSHPELITDESFTISIDTLCEDKYLDCPITDPRDKSIISGNVVVSVTNGSYEYNYVTNT